MRLLQSGVDHCSPRRHGWVVLEIHHAWRGLLDHSVALYSHLMGGLPHSLYGCTGHFIPKRRVPMSAGLIFLGNQGGFDPLNHRLSHAKSVA